MKGIYSYIVAQNLRPGDVVAEPRMTKDYTVSRVDAEHIRLVWVHFEEITMRGLYHRGDKVRILKRDITEYKKEQENGN